MKIAVFEVFLPPKKQQDEGETPSLKIVSAKNKLNPSWWHRWKKSGAIGMMPRTFSLAVVLSVVTKRHLSDDINNEYDLASFLTGDYGVPIPGAESVYEIAREEMARLHPRLWDGEMQFAIGEFILCLERTRPEDVRFLILGWLSKQQARLGFSELTFPFVHRPARP